MGRLGLFGGTFDPIHKGHLKIAQTVKEKMKLDRVIFVPSGEPPHKTDKNVGKKEDRLSMVRLATEPYDHFLVSDYEVARAERSYSVNLIKHFKKEHKDDELFFIIGGDSFYNLPCWYKYEELMEMVSFVVVSRPHQFEKERLLDKFSGDEKPPRVFFIDDVSIDISSSMVRERIKNGEDVKDFVSEPVLGYIEDNGLYV